MSIRYTIQPVTITGKLMGHTIGVYDDIRDAENRLMEAGYHKIGLNDRVYSNTLKGVHCEYAITLITDNDL